MAHGAGPAGAELLHEVEKLAAEGYGKGEIAQRLGFKNPATFSGRLIRASQQTGKPIPAFRGGSRTAHSKGAGTGGHWAHGGPLAGDLSGPPSFRRRLPSKPRLRA